MPPGKILVVDDDQNLLELLKMRLESAGYEVTTASTGRGRPGGRQRTGFRPLDCGSPARTQDGISLMEELHLILPGDAGHHPDGLWNDRKRCGGHEKGSLQLSDQTL